MTSQDEKYIKYYCKRSLELNISNKPNEEQLLRCINLINDNSFELPYVKNGDNTISYLSWSLKYCNSSVSLALIDKFGNNCVPRYIDKYDQTALMYAIIYGKPDVAMKMIDVFGKDCLPQHFWETKNKIGCSALIFACNSNYEQLILKMINTFGKDCFPTRANKNFLGQTPLYYACENNNETIVKELISNFGKDNLPNKINYKGETALIVSCKMGYENIANILLDEFGNDCLPKHVYEERTFLCFYKRMTALDYAMKNNMGSVIEKINNLSHN